MESITIYTEFQFHIGAINRTNKVSVQLFANLFQFHIGAINSYMASKPYMPLMNFNSTLVRLTEGTSYTT